MDYKNGKIYSIRSYQTNLVYYGSTLQTLSKRLSCHRSDCKQYKQGKRNYVSSFDILEFDDNYIELVEKYPCTDRSELEKREGEIIRANNDAINKRMPGVNKSEYSRKWRQNNEVSLKQKRDNNKEEKSKYDKKHRDLNIERLKACHVCECGGQYKIKDKCKHFRTNIHKLFKHT
jgi:hypothetical protein